VIERINDGDIDVMVLLEGPVRFGPDLETSVSAVYPLSVDLGRPISPMPVDVDEYEHGDSPLFHRVRAEGIQA
jgi:hypothetical protein